VVWRQVFLLADWFLPMGFPDSIGKLETCRHVRSCDVPSRKRLARKLY
jgi:hypothetical protein